MSDHLLDIINMYVLVHHDGYVFDQLVENKPIQKDTPNYFQLIGSWLG